MSTSMRELEFGNMYRPIKYVKDSTSREIETDGKCFDVIQPNVENSQKILRKASTNSLSAHHWQNYKVDRKRAGVPWSGRKEKMTRSISNAPSIAWMHENGMIECGWPIKAILKNKLLLNSERAVKLESWYEPQKTDFATMGLFIKQKQINFNFFLFHLCFLLLRFHFRSPCWKISELVLMPQSNRNWYAISREVEDIK